MNEMIRAEGSILGLAAGPKLQTANSSRQNAIRHGLAAETLVGSLDDSDDYRAFEQAVIAD
jgi:hypothetical protein